MPTYLALATGGGAEQLNPVAASGAALAIDAADGNVHDITLTDNCTFTFAALPHTGAGVTHALTLVLRQDATGTRTVTWPASVKWAAGAAPTLSTAGSAIDVISLLSVDDGTTWFGFAAGIGMS